LSLSLALHELGTNAIKYGALSSDTGTIEAVWDLTDHSGEPELDFSWSERGGPAILAPPTRQGFGLRLLQRVLADDIGGR
ncbi:sensor histidine kinase, partial [Acinetobacter baumannii]